MTIFRITRPGANHWGPPDRKTGERKRFGYGDSIELPSSAATDPKWNNLGLVIQGTRDVAAEEAELGQEKANPAVKPAPGDIGADNTSKSDDANESKGGDEGEDDGDEGKAKRERVALLTKLAKMVSDSNGAAEFADARKAVIDADLFEADTVPTKKAEVIEALNDLIAAEDEDE